MKGTAAFVVSAGPFQFEPLVLEHPENVETVELLYCFLRYHLFAFWRGPLGHPPPIVLFESFDLAQDYPCTVILFVGFALRGEPGWQAILEQPRFEGHDRPADRVELVARQIHD